MFWQNKKNSIFSRVSCDFPFPQKMALKSNKNIIIKNRNKPILIEKLIYRKHGCQNSAAMVTSIFETHTRHSDF